MNKPKLAALSVAALHGRDFGCVGWLGHFPRQCRCAAAKMQSDKTPSANAAAQSGDALSTN